MADNPNIGKVITGPDGAQFDMTQVKPAVKGLPTSGPNAFINGVTGEAMQPLPREQVNARYKASRDAFNIRRSEMRDYKASEAAKPLEAKMREAGRSETFINAHKNDTPQMQADFNKAYKANPGPNMTIASPVASPKFAQPAAPSPVSKPVATPAAMAKPMAAPTLNSSPQFKQTMAAAPAMPKFNLSLPQSATSTATMFTPATNLMGKAK